MRYLIGMNWRNRQMQQAKATCKSISKLRHSSTTVRKYLQTFSVFQLNQTFQKYKTKSISATEHRLVQIILASIRNEGCMAFTFLVLNTCTPFIYSSITETQHSNAHLVQFDWSRENRKRLSYTNKCPERNSWWRFLRYVV